MSASLPTANLRKKSKDIVISQLKTGDLIKVKSDFMPMIFHYGIVCREREEFCIYHNDPDKKNRSGGNIVKEDLKDWISGKEIVEVTSSGLDITNIENMVSELKSRKYDLIYFNCEHFVNQIKGKKYSQQITNWAVLLGAVGIAVLVLRAKK